MPMAESFDEWYEMARPRVLATLIVACGDVHLASEATDEAMMRALSKWPTVSSMQSPVGWAVRVGINVMRRRRRRAAIEQRLLRRERAAAPMAAPAGEAWMLVRDLPPRQREVLVMRYVADMSEAEIAKTLGVSRSAVSSALTDGRRRMAEQLRDPDVAPTPVSPEEVRHV